MIVADPKDALLPLQKSYFDKLSAGLAQEVFDSVPEDGAMPFVTIGPFTAADDSDKSEYGFQVTGSVQVWTSFPKNTGGRLSCLTIADDVIALIRTRDDRITVDGFNVVSSVLEFQDVIEEETETERIYRCVLRFRHVIFQN